MQAQKVIPFRDEYEDLGPGFEWRIACQWGVTGYCKHGWHRKCQFSDPDFLGPAMPMTYLKDRRGNLVTDEQHREVEVGPWHRWRCPCDCHELGIPGAQLDLF